MTVGYDPDRLNALALRTRMAIDAIAALRSNDPAAANAMRALRVLRRNLEDHWMPALLEIQRSDAMTSWNSNEIDTPWWMGTRPVGHTLLPDHLRPGTALAPLTDARLLEFCRHLDRLLLTDDPPDADLDPLAAELAARVRRDPSFADRLAELAPSTPLIGFLTARAWFPTSFSTRLVRSMMWPHGPAGTVELEQYAGALSTVLASLVDDPDVCLDLLLDRVVLHGIASWERLDADVVTHFVVSGLYGAVANSPQRLVEGYDVLTDLTRLVNGPLDRGIHPGLALGVAASLPGYVDTLAPAIRQEGSYPVLVVDDGFEAEIGTYDDVVDLFGSLLRDPAAQAALGTTLGAYTTRVAIDLGADIVSGPGLQYVSRFTDLIADASRTEQAELVMQAAAEEAGRRRLGAIIGFGVVGALSLGGAGSVARAVVSRSLTLATDFVAEVDPEQLPDARIPSQTYDLITVGVLTVVATDPGERRRAGLRGVPRRDWTELGRRIDEIDTADDPDERTRRILRLDHWIEADVPLLAGYLGRVRSSPGMDELTEGRTAVGTD